MKDFSSGESLRTASIILNLETRSASIDPVRRLNGAKVRPKKITEPFASMSRIQRADEGSSGIRSRNRRTVASRPSIQNSSKVRSPLFQPAHRIGEDSAKLEDIGVSGGTRGIWSAQTAPTRVGIGPVRLEPSQGRAERSG